MICEDLENGKGLKDVGAICRTLELSDFLNSARALRRRFEKTSSQKNFARQGRNEDQKENKHDRRQ